MVKQKGKPFIRMAVFSLMVTVAFTVVSLMILANIIASERVDIVAVRWTVPVATLLGLTIGNIMIKAVTCERNVIKMAILPCTLFLLMLLGHMLIFGGKFYVTWQTLLAYILPISIAILGGGKRNRNTHHRR